MKKKIFTSILILLVTFTLSFTSVFAETMSPTDTQEDNQTMPTENAENAESTEKIDEHDDTGSKDKAPSVRKALPPETTKEKSTPSGSEQMQKPLTESGSGLAQAQSAQITYKPLDFATKDLGLKTKLVSTNKDDSRTLTWGKSINYIFTLIPQGNAPGTKKSVTVSLSNNYKTPSVEKVVDLGTLRFTEPGTYQYTVTESLQENKADLFSKFFTRNDTKSRTITITVSEKQSNGVSTQTEKELNVKSSVSGGAFRNRLSDIDRPTSVMVKPAGINKVKTSLPGGFKHAKVYQCEGRSTSTGTYIVWYHVGGANGYMIYKKSGTSGKWKFVKKVKGWSYLSYRDKHVKNGGFYQYKVIAYTRNTSKKPKINPRDNTGIMSTYFLTKPVCSHSGKTVSWRTNSKADGMRVEVSKNNIFIGSQVYMVPKGTNRLSIPNYSTSNGGYKYVRVMPYKKFDGRYHYGLPWLNRNTYKPFYTNVSFIVKDKFKNQASKHQNKKDVKEMLAMAGQKMWGWDTTQGITYDGRYAYMNVENRYANSIKVIKMDTTNNFKVIKVSAPVRGCHGNDITYNSDTKKLYITYSYFNKRYVARMNPKNMKYEGRNHIKVPYHIAGPHGHKAIQNLNCYNEISYDNVKKQYLLKKKESHSMVVLDKHFKVIRYMRIHERVEITNQNMQASPEFFFRVQSNYQSNQKNNYVTVFDWHGTYITHFNLKFDGVLGKAELENIFFIGDQMYGACYKKWWDKMPVGSTVKLDKVKKHGKWVFKTKKVTKKNQKKLKQLRRTSYIFRIKAFG